MQQVTLFDYGQLDAETRTVVQKRTGEIKALVRRSARDIIEIGQKLIEVKDRLPHGGFGKWLEAEFQWSERTARNFMRVADQFKSETVADLDMHAKALYLLASPSTPEPARTEALERAEQGEPITHSAAKTIVDNHRSDNGHASNGTGKPADYEQEADEARGEADGYDWTPEPEETGERLPKSKRDCNDSDEYYTPPSIIKAARQLMGDIDLDPASCELAQSIVEAGTYYTRENDGLTKTWSGRIWLNPPFSDPKPFVLKAIEEYEQGNINQAVILVNNGTETEWGQALLQRFIVCFVNYRIAFWRADPEQPAKGNRYAQMIFYVGHKHKRFIDLFSRFGTIKE